ncbi:hypothetical protein GCM10007962_10990 [Yeosuana aromativorans]|uniref:MlpB protein n=1 Tax=Yeosuana aromativorans TaxID=288019 RepID=A0A8J3BJE6_9FLAO|nr:MULTISPECIES: hypothetical protein [Yeosuana]GGK18614.1 hypothetical protein GCM10007962_10990 [Yeosuana aromativorans]|tara:strand:+ start:133 stop:567 length:435 start_codon:yes stop_codon:yes gene_type:complete
MKTSRKYLFISALFISAFISSCKNQDNKKEPVGTNQIESPTKMISKSAQAAKIESSKVCYVNNKFMGIDQIPVVFEGKTYYGCCPDCVGKLKSIREVRYSKDPLTGKEVDKALAYIVLSPQGNNDVLYFESEQSYKKYFKFHKK